MQSRGSGRTVAQPVTNRSHIWGETAAFLALFLDNIGVLVFFRGILVCTFNYPPQVILTHMIPGTALGVFLGDLVYAWLALRLRRATGRADITAMPLGLDTPSSIGLAFAVLGPAYVATHDAILTSQIGMATLFMIGATNLTDIKSLQRT
jgi:AGZA family xanthine/uracil permease-like MFS transporter